jgi:hypothetical protein
MATIECPPAPDRSTLNPIDPPEPATCRARNAQAQVQHIECNHISAGERYAG